VFFGGEFGDFDGVYIHCIGVMGFRGRRGEHLIRVGWFNVLPSNFIGAIPLSLEVNSLFVPVADGSGNGVHGHDTAHQRGGNPSRVVSNENIFVVDGRHSYVVLEEGGVFCEGWGEFVSSFVLSRFLNHLFGREPGDGIRFHVMVFKRGFKIGDKDCEGSHGDGGAYEGIVSEHCCPC